MQSPLATKLSPDIHVWTHTYMCRYMATMLMKVQILITLQYAKMDGGKAWEWNYYVYTCTLARFSNITVTLHKYLCQRRDSYKHSWNKRHACMYDCVVVYWSKSSLCFCCYSFTVMGMFDTIISSSQLLYRLFYYTQHLLVLILQLLESSHWAIQYRYTMIVQLVTFQSQSTSSSKAGRDGWLNYIGLYVFCPQLQIASLEKQELLY